LLCFPPILARHPGPAFLSFLAFPPRAAFVFIGEHLSAGNFHLLCPFYGQLTPAPRPQSRSFERPIPKTPCGLYVLASRFVWFQFLVVSFSLNLFARNRTRTNPCLRPVLSSRKWIRVPPPPPESFSGKRMMETSPPFPFTFFMGFPQCANHSAPLRFPIFFFFPPPSQAWPVIFQFPVTFSRTLHDSSFQLHSPFFPVKVTSGHRMTFVHPAPPPPHVNSPRQGMAVFGPVSICIRFRRFFFLLSFSDHNAGLSPKTSLQDVARRCVSFLRLISSPFFFG